MAVRFYCDSNVQRLAKWLRFAGFDTFFRAELPLSKIDHLCQKERRVFITRSKKKDVRRLLCSVEILESEDVFVQLKVILSKYPVCEEKIGTLCIRCNVRLRVSDKLQGVPEHITEAVYCPRCGRLYWKGSHYENMVGVLGVRG